ncbi:hypothetical protein DITRI_Ditri10aG0171800 [Diplodiscus trichospermus]
MKMLVIQKSLISKAIVDPYLLDRRNNRRFRFVTKMSRKRKDVDEISRSQQLPSFPLRVSNTIVARSVVAVSALGFLDAGYSGDWTRIGVISKEVEELLKIAAFVVVPLCIFLIFSFSSEPADKS